MVSIEIASLGHELRGNPVWLEGVLYATCLGARLGLGNQAPDTLDSSANTFRIRGADYSHYHFWGNGSGVPTAFIEESLLVQPRTDTEIRGWAGGICGVVAHEAVHHRIATNGYKMVTLGQELDEKIPANLRGYILEQLDVHALARVSGATGADIRRHWAATSEQMRANQVEEALEGERVNIASGDEGVDQAAFDARAEFLCQVAACLSRFHLIYGSLYARSLTNALIQEHKIPEQLPHLLKETIDFACHSLAEAEAITQALQFLSSDSSTDALEARHESIAAGEWPDNLSGMLRLVRHPKHP